MYKVGDKVRIKSIDWYNENKDKYGIIMFSTDSGDYTFTKEDTHFCGQVVTIEHEGKGYYLIAEDDRGYFWIDEMIEGLSTSEYNEGDFVGVYGYETDVMIEEVRWDGSSYSYKVYLADEETWLYDDDIAYKKNETIEKFVEEKIKPKFKVGDRIITDTNMKGKIIEIVEDGWYHIDFEPYNGIPQPNGVIPEENMLLVEEKCNYVQANNIPDITQAKTSSACSHNGFYGYSDSDGNETSEWNLPEGYQFIDENGNVINATKIVLEKKCDNNKLKLESIKKVREYWSEYARIFIEIYDDSPNECVFTHLWVVDEQRQKGHGKRALMEAETIAKELGCHAAYLKVETDSWMHHWYLRCGYIWYKNAPDNYTWLTKGL